MAQATDVTEMLRQHVAQSGSECHIVGDMSVANFLLLYCFKPCINLLVNIMIGLYKIKYTMI